MLHLAEIKKQSKPFVGALRSELKLLAFQRNDQTWSAVTGEKIVTSEEIPQIKDGEGALFIVSINGNEQIQGKPELAGSRLVNLLKSFSKIIEKSKGQEEEIEQWKQSLTYQSQELARREMEMESRLEQLEEKEKEYEQLSLERDRLEEDKKRIEEEQEKLENLQESVSFDGQQASKLKELMDSLLGKVMGTDSFLEKLQETFETVETLQGYFDQNWQQLEQKKAEKDRKQKEVDREDELLKNYKSQLKSELIEIEEAKRNLEGQQKVLESKQEAYSRLNLYLETTEKLKESIQEVMPDRDSDEDRLDLNSLENMPLGELEEIVNNLQKEMDKLVVFVNDQEEELTLQYQTVKELEEKIKSVGDLERFSLETDLADEQERTKMLDETLLGQRRNLRKQQKILSQHLKILRRRQGLIDIKNNPDEEIDLEPILNQLQEQTDNTTEEKQKLEGEIEHIKQSLEQIREMIGKQVSSHQTKEEQLEQQEQQYQGLKTELTGINAEIALYKAILEQEQTTLNKTKEKLNAIKELIDSSQSTNEEREQVIAEIKETIGL